MTDRLTLPDRLPEGYRETRDTGLTEEEAAAAMAAGDGNGMPEDGGKTWQQILFRNVFTFFNLLNLCLAAALICVGSYRNLMFMGVVISNILIGTVQEFRAQQTIRRLKLMNAPAAHLLREGKESVRNPAEAVRGDLAVFRAGDQVIADAVVTAGSGSAMEALLTGESNAIPKAEGSWLYSGSYVTEGCLTGQLVYVAGESYVGQLTREAKKAHRPESRLMADLERLIRADSMVLVPLGILLFLRQTLLNHAPLSTAVPASVAAMLGMIPEGLMLLTSIAMAVGVVRLGRRGTLVQELGGIETLARVDVLCLDKTGTITTGRMTLDTLEPAVGTEAELREKLSRFLGASRDEGSTLTALREAVPPAEAEAASAMPFSSKRKKSAVIFPDGTALILGAPGFVLGEAWTGDLKRRVKEWTGTGRRVLALAEGRAPAEGEDFPPVTGLAGWVVLRDEVRPAAAETVRYFREQGVEVKVISGDDPDTAASAAREAGLDGWERRADASELRDPAALAEACERVTVFGRVTPGQKKTLVEALRSRGHNVAMTGDGVNDIPAMKAADCSIAMAGGSDAARHAAQLTLLNSDFAVMPEIVLEGRRVINNITRAASLFLTKTIFSFLLSVLLLFLPGGYPFQPIQLTLISGLTVGIPGFFLALEPSRERIRGSFLRTVLLRALPGGCAVACCAAAGMLLTAFGRDAAECSTLATLSGAFMGLVVLWDACCPLNLKRGILLAACAAAMAAVMTLFPKFFFLTPMTGRTLITFAALIVPGCGIYALIRFLIRRSASAET